MSYVESTIWVGQSWKAGMEEWHSDISYKGCIGQKKRLKPTVFNKYQETQVLTLLNAVYLNMLSFWLLQETVFIYDHLLYLYLIKPGNIFWYTEIFYSKSGPYDKKQKRNCFQENDAKYSPCSNQIQNWSFDKPEKQLVLVYLLSCLITRCEPTQGQNGTKFIFKYRKPSGNPDQNLLNI